MTQELIKEGRYEGTITGVSLSTDGGSRAYVDILIHTTGGIDHKWSMTLDPANSVDLGYRMRDLKQLGWDGRDIEQLATQITNLPVAFGIAHETRKKDGSKWAKTFLSNTPVREVKPLTKAFAATLNKALQGALVDDAPAKVSPVAARAAAAAAARTARPKAAEAELDDNF